MTAETVGRPRSPATVSHCEGRPALRSVHGASEDPSREAGSLVPEPRDDSDGGSLSETAALRAEITRLETDLAAATQRADHLAIALESNRTIGAAVGILMTRLRIPEDQAFELLRTASQHGNRKLRVVAAGVVYTGGLEIVRQPASVGGSDLARG